MSYVPQSLHRPRRMLFLQCYAQLYIGHILPYVTQAVVIIQITTRFPSELPEEDFVNETCYSFMIMLCSIHDFMTYPTPWTGQLCPRCLQYKATIPSCCEDLANIKISAVQSSI
jgi:hypothetical protein